MGSFSKNSTVLLIITGAIAVALALASFQYSNFTSDKVTEIATENARLAAKTEAYNIARILTNKIEVITTNLNIIASAPYVKEGSGGEGRILFDAADNAIEPPVDFFAWLDQDGKLLWSSNVNQTTYQRFKGTDLSARPYFLGPRDTHQPYFSSIIDSIDNNPRIFISVPIIDEEQEFRGIAFSGYRLDQAGQLLQQELPDEFEGRIVLLDKDGIILHTRNQSYIGKHVLDEEILSTVFPSIIPQEENKAFDVLVANSIQGRSGSADFTIRGTKSTVAFEPVFLDGQHFLTLYIISPHQVAGNVAALVEQQRNFSTIIAGVIAAVAVGIGILIMVGNRRLEGTVATRTSQLQSKTEELKTSYNALASANEQLKVHDRLQKEFINIAAHELRTPTQAILGYAELLQMDPDGGEEMINAIYRNSVRLQRLTSDILDVTRIESESLKLEKERLNLSDIISAAIRDTKNQFVNGRIKFAYQPNDVYVNADRTRITQVISNLLDNAVKFTKEGTITVSAESRNGNAIVTVADTGKGIDGDIMPRLFMKFATKSDKGTGLGLFISRSVIEAHNGRIWASNNSDSKGATFGFSLSA